MKTLNWQRMFVISAVICLALTGIAKIASVLLADENTKYFREIDPLIGLSFSTLLSFAGVIELLTASLCLVFRQTQLQALTILYVSSGVAMYRTGLYLIDYKKPCYCLGSLTDAINISPEVSDIAMIIMTIYLLVGSSTILFNDIRATKVARMSNRISMLTG